jgi:uncharacterized protein YciI
MREQAGWDDHATFMDGLVEEGFILLAGPLEGDRETLWIVEAESKEEIRERMAQDPWAANGMLRPVRIEHWTVVLDGRDSSKVQGRKKARRPASAGQLLERERHTKQQRLRARPGEKAEAER